MFNRKTTQPWSIIPIGDTLAICRPSGRDNSIKHIVGRVADMRAAARFIEAYEMIL